MKAFLLVLWTLAAASGAQGVNPLVQTESGDVMGRNVQVGDKTVSVYYKIPYAEPPTGDLRFRPPRPAQPWNDTLDVSDSKPDSCYQARDEMFPDFAGAKMWDPPGELSEDCLYVTVYVPLTEPRVTSAEVMVWFYGGAFQSGASSLDVYDGKALAAEGVIVVSMNYRLGALGFLYLADEAAPGNVGLRDQELALDWVQKNIQKFGGDPGKVTLFGESAGAVSVGLHLLHEGSWDKFGRAILQSSAPTTQVQDAHENFKSALSWAHSMGCDQENITDVVACLRELDVKKLFEDNDVGGWLVNFRKPVVDGEWLTAHPKDLIEAGNFKKCQVLSGVVKNEGAYFLFYYIPDLSNLDGFAMNGEQLEKAVPRLFQHNSNQNVAVVDRLTYWMDPNNETENYRRLEEGYGLQRFTCPVIQLQRAYAAAGQDVYAYEFTHRSDKHLWPEYMGVLHGDEILYIFGDPLLREAEYTDLDRNVSRKMMQYWVQFAKNGNPDPEWPKYDSEEEKYVVLDAEHLDDLESGVRKKLHATGCHFWDEVISTLGEGHCSMVASAPVRLPTSLAPIVSVALLSVKLLL